ncbi:hypothetical protein WOLCODRAFT_140394, partial [Wolfiporia cocos MD-104 SS10]
MARTKHTASRSTSVSNDTASSIMKQGKLGFSSTKRAASTGSASTAKSKPTRSTTKRTRSSLAESSSEVSSSDEEGSVRAGEAGAVTSGTAKSTVGKRKSANDGQTTVKKRRLRAKVFGSRDGAENAGEEISEDAVKAVGSAPAGEVEKGKLDLKNLKGRWRKHYGVVREKMGNLEPVHAQGQTPIDHILRSFDLSYEYGPCVGVSRLARWERAEALGLNPPAEVKEILMTKEGSEDNRYSQCVFYGEV